MDGHEDYPRRGDPMLKKASLLLLASVLALSVGVPAAQAVQPMSGGCTNNRCDVDVDVPGATPGPGDSKPGGVDVVLQPGPTECKQGDKEVECTSDKGSWSNADECYWRLADPQKAPPGGKTAGDGAWYECTRPLGGQLGLDAISSTRWLDQPPPGVVAITPAQAAAQLLRQFVFQGVPIGIAPEAKAGSKGSVGLPVWMWVSAPSQQTYGPWAQSATIGGVAITGTAHVTSIDWNMGDGTVISCANAGTAYQEGFGLSPSPTCGHMYTRMSKDQPGGKYTVTATSNWTFDWTAGGQTGTATATAQNSTQIEIGEMQTVIVNR